jgi:hypothetical protein
VTARPRRIEVAIDELVLYGFDVRHRHSIAEAVQAELAVVLQGWSPTAGASAGRLEAGSFAVTAAAPPAAVGRGVARQVGQAVQAAATPETGTSGTGTPGTGTPGTGTPGTGTPGTGTPEGRS